MNKSFLLAPPIVFFWIAASVVGTVIESKFRFSYTGIWCPPGSGGRLSAVTKPGANLSNCNFASSDLSNANLQGVDLTNANLKNADLTGAVTQEVDFTGSNRNGCIGCPA